MSDACLWFTLQIRLALEGRGAAQSGASNVPSPAIAQQSSGPAAIQQPLGAFLAPQSSPSAQDMATAASETPVGSSGHAAGATQAQPAPAAGMQERMQEDLQAALSQKATEPADPVFDLAGFQVSHMSLQTS